MTQNTYCDVVLPRYIEAINTLTQKYGGQFYLVEDGDSSHGLVKPGRAQEMRDAAGIKNLSHPANSPELNPKEAAWNILKQRVRTRTWNSLPELKQIIQEVWKGITIEEIRARIEEMPWRCQRLVDYDGKRIRSKLW
jgi:DDE superfamily endonuclease